MTTLSLLPPGRCQFLTPNNVPLVGGTVETYQPGTFNLVDTYQDPLGATTNPHPITLDAIGSCVIWASGSIRQIVWDAQGNQIWDQVTTAPASGTGVLLSANNLSDVANAATSRTNLGLGTAAVSNLGTSGATVPLWNVAGTFSGALLYSGPVTFGALTQLQTPNGPTAPIGYRNLPQIISSITYTLTIGDAAVQRFFTGNANCIIPTAATVPFLIGEIVQIVWDAGFSGSVVATSGVTLRNPIGNVTGNRTVTGPGFATIQKMKTNEWWIIGAVNMT